MPDVIYKNTKYRVQWPEHVKKLLNEVAEKYRKSQRIDWSSAVVNGELSTLPSSLQNAALISNYYSSMGGRISMGHCSIPEKQKWVNGASMMFKRKMVDQIGLLDESMFLLYSESDYCYVAREKGWEVWYEPKSHIIHRLGKASKLSGDWQKKDVAAFMRKWGITFLYLQY